MHIFVYAVVDESRNGTTGATRPTDRMRIADAPVVKRDPRPFLLERVRRPNSLNRPPFTLSS
jgi:hypothetical protein